MKTNCLAKTLLLLSLLFLFNASFAQSGLTRGLIAYYPFDGNANDVSGNGNNGTPENNIQLTADRFGIANSAYNFDGVDDYIRIPNSSSLDVSTAMSVALYFKASQIHFKH